MDILDDLDGSIRRLDRALWFIREAKQSLAYPLPFLEADRELFGVEETLGDAIQRIDAALGIVQHRAQEAENSMQRIADIVESLRPYHSIGARPG